MRGRITDLFAMIIYRFTQVLQLPSIDAELPPSASCGSYPSLRGSEVLLYEPLVPVLTFVCVISPVGLSYKLL